MREIEVELPAGAVLQPVPALVESALTRQGLSLSRHGSLAKYPGSLHWHCRLGRERGTLELTFWPARRRLWFKISGGRGAAWIDQALPGLAAAVEHVLATPEVRVVEQPAER